MIEYFYDNLSMCMSKHYLFGLMIIKEYLLLGLTQPNYILLQSLYYKKESIQNLNEYTQKKYMPLNN